MTSRQAERLRTWLAATVVSALFGAAYSTLAAGAAAAIPLLVGAGYGAIIGGCFSGYQLFYVDGPGGAWLRRAPFLTSAALRIGMGVALMLAMILVCRMLFSFLDDGNDRFAAGPLLRDLVFSSFVATIILLVVQVRRVVGGRQLADIVLGRYTRPVRSDRVFLFLDLANSTRLAQELGDEGVQALIARVFFDIDTIIVDHGGETHRYIGDEVVVTWPLADCVGDARCLRCTFAIFDAVAAQSHFYRAQFGAAPRFRAGLHGGPIVAAQIGDSKQQIVYFGDTVNTAARIQAQCKTQGVPLLVSGDLLAAIRVPVGLHCKPLGNVRLRGRAGDTALFTVTRTAEAA